MSVDGGAVNPKKTPMRHASDLACSAERPETGALRYARSEPYDLEAI